MGLGVCACDGANVMVEHTEVTWFKRVKWYGVGGVCDGANVMIKQVAVM